MKITAAEAQRSAGWQLAISSLSVTSPRAATSKPRNQRCKGGRFLVLVAYNLLAVVLAALHGIHGEETVDEKASLYYIANEISTPYHSMMITIPAPEWDVFDSMRAADLAALLLDLAQRVRLQTIRKSPRWAKRSRPQGKNQPGKDMLPRLNCS